MSNVPRAVAATLLGAIAGAAWFVLAYALRPTLTLDMSSDLPSFVRGMHPVERDTSGLTFAWTMQQVDLSLPGLDRRADWYLSVVMRGARPDPAMLPDVTFAVDGATVLTRRTTNDFEGVRVIVPARPPGTRGATLTMSVSSAFVPGPQDPRQLGVMIDALSLEPAGGHVVLPPRRALACATLAAATFGAVFGLIGLLPITAIGAAVLIGAAQTMVICRGLGPYAPYAIQPPQIASWIGLGTLATVVLVERATRQPLRHTARFVAAFSAGALYLKLLVLLHPNLPIGDALFHAHRFQTVLAGNYYFTSVAPGLYEFPYAIALYVFSIPFTVFTSNWRDHVPLLRIAVASADTVAGLFLYLMIVKAWGDRLAGAIAVALYHLIPLDFRVQTIGNLTNAFGQSLFVAAMAGITADSLRRDPLSVMWLTAAIAAAFLAHTSTFAIFFVVAFAVAALYRWRGGPALRPAAGAVLLAAAAASVLSFVVYYAHFWDLYRAQFARITGELSRPAAESDPAGRSIADRAIAVPGYIAGYFGWPTIGLAAAGARMLWRNGARDRLSLALVAWASACLLFLAVGVLTPVDMRYYYAVFPALAIAGGLCGSRAWQAGGPARVAAVGLLGWAAWIGTRVWIERVP